MRQWIKKRIEAINTLSNDIIVNIKPLSQLNKETETLPKTIEEFINEINFVFNKV